MTIERTELLARKITTLDEAKRWIKDLVDLDLSFHFEDRAANIVNIKTGARTFTDDEAALADERVNELYGFDFEGCGGCPIGHMLDLIEPGWRTR